LKSQIEKYLIDGLQGDKHYVEGKDGEFYLLRGTNRNESLHKRIRHIWPEKLGEKLATNLKTAFIFQ